MCVYVWSGEHCLPRPHVHHLESFVISCLRIILSVSVRKKKRHTTMRTMAKHQRISSILSQHHVRFLGHLSMMPRDQLPRQLLVCAPAGGKCSAGGQKRQWNGVVASDLKKCNLSGTWREYAQECDSWCTTIHHSVEHLNIEAENNEKTGKDEKKHRREQRLIDSMHLPRPYQGRSDQPSVQT